MRDAGLMATEIPIINITSQPEELSVIKGKITENISVSASATDGRKLNYQWYSNTSESNQNGQIIVEAMSNVFKIPENLTEGRYYYYCEVKAEDVQTVTSNVAVVKVSTS